MQEDDDRMHPEPGPGGGTDARSPLRTTSTPRCSTRPPRAGTPAYAAINVTSSETLNVFATLRVPFAERGHIIPADAPLRLADRLRRFLNDD